MGISDRICRVSAGSMLPPSCCVVCGKSAYQVDEEFLDIRVDIDEYGKIYFCLDCAKEIGNEVEKSVSRVKYDEAQNLNATLQAQLNDLERVKRILDGYHPSTSNPGLSLVSGGSDVLTVTTTNEPESDDQYSFDEFDFGPTESESESTESSTVTGPDDTVKPGNSDGKFTDLEL